MQYISYVNQSVIINYSKPNVSFVCQVDNDKSSFETVGQHPFNSKEMQLLQNISH